jgi:outer membrane protein OmpA-like peptidoglycan-associated protein
MGITNSSTPYERGIRVALIAAMAFASTACSLNRKEKGAMIGGAAGAAAGAAIGNKTGSTARGAIIGAVVGGSAGAIIGHQMDQQAKELVVEIPGAVVERVGEGIQITFDSGLLYDFDSSEIRTAAGVNLRNLAASLTKYANTDLLIVGHTDSQGTPAYNQGLSLRRANAASAYLQMQGVSGQRIFTDGKGEMEPVATNETEFGRQTNRRIEVAIYASASAEGSR